MIENNDQLISSLKILKQYEIYRKQLVESLKVINLSPRQKVMAVMPSDIFIKKIQEEVNTYLVKKTSVRL